MEEIVRQCNDRRAFGGNDGSAGSKNRSQVARVMCSVRAVSPCLPQKAL
jgi:hypothetical protein